MSYLLLLLMFIIVTKLVTSQLAIFCLWMIQLNWRFDLVSRYLVVGKRVTMSVIMFQVMNIFLIKVGFENLEWNPVLGCCTGFPMSNSFGFKHFRDKSFELYLPGNNYELKMRFVDHIFDDFIVDHFTLRIILPEGSKYVPPFNVYNLLPSSVVNYENFVCNWFLMPSPNELDQ